jgi:UrcA family protein
MKLKALILAAFAAGVMTVPARAQEEEGFTVRAPYVAKRIYTGAQPSEETIALSTVVATRDLNLHRAWDRSELFRRVDYAAQDVCRDLKRLYPDGNVENCLSDARRSGQRQANYLIQIRG